MTELELYDNTRISEFRRCPRYFFFRHVMNWRRDNAYELALVFGGGWHAAMDVLWSGINNGKPRGQVLESSYAAFVNYWTEAGAPEPAEIDMEMAKDLNPRTPMIALDKLEYYYDKRQRFISETTILETERPFAVPLSPTDDKLFYIGRIDKVIQVDKRRVRGIEHKTTSAMRLNGRSEHKIAPNYMESWSPNSQVDGYSYALYMLYPTLRNDVWVDATLVHKTGEDAQFIPVERTLPMLDAFLFDTHRWIEIIREEKAALQELKPSDPHMAAFPKNTNSCFDFNRACPFLDICKARPNPLSYEETPTGYKVEKWDPLKHAGTPKEIEDLTKSQQS